MNPPQKVGARIGSPGFRINGCESPFQPLLELPRHNTSVHRNIDVYKRQGQNLFVEDLGSKNGTAVNGRPVHDPVALRNKDLVTIGDVDIRVRNQ